MKKGLFGLVLGIAGGVVAAILLAPKRRTDGQASSGGPAGVADTLVGSAQTAMDGAQSLLKLMTPSDGSGMLPDERITERVRNDLERRGIWQPRLDVTTIDGTVYLRGRETEPGRVETIVGAIRSVDGVAEVVDEVRKE